MIATAPRRKPSSAASNRAERESGKWRSTNDIPARIVAACQRGDRAAQRELYELCSPKMFRLAVRMVGIQEATDVTQQVFLQVYRSIGQFSDRSRFETWLYRLAINECLQFRRRAMRRPFEPVEVEPADHRAGPTARVQDRELLELALQRLDAELRSLFLLRELEGLAYRELAEVLEISEGTVASRLNRARSQLKENLLELGWQP
ncbi:MAG: RNA polymerase sigma factor [Pirellulales bacterium]|nr:RNA polymerase sigma factor [Pirellulales bacterium]